jgi:hypothetical protein
MVTVDSFPFFAVAQKAADDTNPMSMKRISPMAIPFHAFPGRYSLFIFLRSSPAAMCKKGWV